MKIVVNECFGGFSLSDWACEALGLTHMEGREIDRRDSRLVDLVEKYGERCNNSYSELGIVEIPDWSTDWIMTDYDGIETVYYVIDGKIYST